MSNKRRSLFRKSGFREQVPVILIATEGKETEPQYFEIFKRMKNNVQIRILGSNKGGSSPTAVQKRMMKEIKENEIGERDKAWLVIDTDQWKTNQLNAAYEWSISKANYGLAVSNPMFEYWLLLHFEEGHDIHSKQECVDRLLRQLPGYRKNNINRDKFTLSRTGEAIIRAKNKDNPPCVKWPEITGTTVYKLVEMLIT